MAQNIREFNFDTDIEATLARIKELLLVKGKEYRRNNNPYHNFERGAEIRNKSPFEVLEMFRLKHLISVEDMQNDLKKGISPNKEKVNEKYDDIIVYYLIEKAMMLNLAK